MTPPSEAAVRHRPGRLARFASRFAEALRLALSRFPFTAGAVLLLAALTNLKIAGIAVVTPANELRAASALGVAAAASVATALFLERVAGSAVVRLLGASAAGVLAALVVWVGWSGGVFVPPFVAAAILAVPLAPHLVRSNALRFWTFTLWSGFGASLGFLSVLLFVVGVSAILEMVRYLFGIGLGSRAYEHIYATAMLLVGPLFALGRVPREFDEEVDVERSDRFVAGVAVLLNWVATPLVLAAAAILHLYAAKILATGEVPKNQIGWIVGVYAVLVLSLRVAAAPFLRVGGAVHRLFGYLWLPILIVPVLLLGYAVWLRVGPEGFTLQRYYLALAAIAAAAIAAAQALPVLRGDIRGMVAVPVLLLAASSVGPWGVASTVARSQTQLIEREFAGGDGRLRTEGLSESRRDVLRSRVAALAEVERLARLRPLLTVEAVARLDAAAEPDRTAYMQALRIDYGEPSPQFASFAAETSPPFDVSGFDTVLLRLAANEGGEPSGEPAAAIRDGRIELRFRGTVDSLDAAPIVGRVLPADGGVTAGKEPVGVDMTTLGGRTVRLRVTSLVRAATAVAPASIGFDMAVRAAEWPQVSLGGDGQR